MSSHLTSHLVGQGLVASSVQDIKQYPPIGLSYSLTPLLLTTTTSRQVQTLQETLKGTSHNPHSRPLQATAPHILQPVLPPEGQA